jgi:hypothetical protein
MRLITKETRVLSRPQVEQTSQKKGHRRSGGLTIESAEGVRFAYSSMAVPGFVGGIATAEYVEHLGPLVSADDAENHPLQIATETSEEP